MKLWLRKDKAHRSKKLTNPGESISHPLTLTFRHTLYMIHTHNPTVRKDISRSRKAQVTRWRYIW